MAWPQGSDFQDAVQEPSAFSDPELRAAEYATTPLGLPQVASGQFGVVYQFRASDGRRWAVKCFTKDIPDRAARYRKLSEHLADNRLGFLIDFQYQHEGIRVKGSRYPLLKMQWVEGQRLNKFIGDRIGQPAVEKISAMWVKVAQMLHDAKVTHADLQHGNILLVPATTEGRASLRLVDYDGMYLPSLAGTTSGEVGHPSFQHPTRLRTGYYGPEVDRFSHLAIYTALQAVIARGKPIWDAYDNNDNLLFRESDFAAPGESKLFRDLWENGPDNVRNLTGQLVLATKQSFGELPLLDAAIAATLDARQRREVEGILGISRKAASPPPPIFADEFELTLDDEEESDLSDDGEVISLGGDTSSGWPDETNDLFEAVKNPSVFGDSDIQKSDLVRDEVGFPQITWGEYSMVFQFRSPRGNRWAVKMFPFREPERERHYRAISDHLARARLPFMVNFAYLSQGVRVKGVWYPILKMEWAEGQNLAEYVKANLGNPTALTNLLQQWVKLAQQLRQANVAHGDLEHTNVLVQSRPGGAATLKLVDYDGMHLPGMVRGSLGERGRANYQHPQRQLEWYDGPEADRFSHLVIVTALQALIARGKSLWDAHDNNENLLFRETDFTEPGKSKLLRDLWENGPENVRNLAGHLTLALGQDVAEVTLLDTALNTTLNASQRREVESILGVKAKGSTGPSVTPPKPSAVPTAGNGLESLDAIERLLRTLSGKEREVVRMYYLEGRTYEEISTETSVPVNEIGAILARSRKKLRESAPSPAPPAPPPPPVAVSRSSAPRLTHITGDEVLTAPVFQENIGTFPVAYGLALQGIKRSRFSVNLSLPEEGGFFSRLRKRMSKGKPSDEAAWGIDIGQCALKAMRLELIDDEITATAFDYIEHSKVLSQPDADPDALISEAIEKFLSRNDIKNDTIAVSINGQSGLARFVKLPPVEEKKIADIVKHEAKQQIPFPLDEVVWDYQIIAQGDPVDTAFALETEIGLFAVKKDVVARALKPFTDHEVDVHIFQLAPLALVNFATHELLDQMLNANDTPKGKKRCIVVLDIGTDSSSLIITDGEKIIWQRPIPLGGNNFTRALTKEMKLTFAKAEHLKRNAAKSAELANILKAIKSVLTDFVGEVQRSLGYFTNTHRDAFVAGMVGLGGAFKLPGLQKFMADKLSIDVQKLT